MNYGTEKTTRKIDNDFTMVDIKKIKEGEPYKTMRQYRMRVSVRDAQEEMTEFIRFTEELVSRRKEGKLVCDKHDPDTYPAFILEYPKTDKGSYFVIKSYTILLDEL